MLKNCPIMLFNWFYYASENCLLCFTWITLCQLIILFMTKCGWTLTCHVSVGKDARLWRLRCCRCYHADHRSSCSLIRLSILWTVSPWCCMFSLLLFLLMNIQFSANSTIMLLTALHYASICSYASTLLLCSKLCQHNSPRPNHSLLPRLSSHPEPAAWDWFRMQVQQYRFNFKL